MREALLGADDVLRPAGQLDLAGYYAVMADACQDYLGDRELATKILIPDGPTLIKRGSDLEPLTASDLAGAVDSAFLELRSEIEHLGDARSDITEMQDTVWQYVFPRKYLAFFYATNHEGEGGTIDRVFFDIDRGAGVSADDVLAVARAFVSFLKDDSTARDVTDRSVIAWTGHSFHIELLLDEERPHAFYKDQVLTTQSEERNTITERGVSAVQNAVDVDVVGGHEKQSGRVAIDPSQTPSGKLDRVPLGSLHLADAETVDGVSVPLTEEELFEESVLDRVQDYTPRLVLERVEELAEKL